MAEMPESAAREVADGIGEVAASGASNVTAGTENGDPSEQRMLEEVVERQNMRAAYQQVKRNTGAPGIDGMSVEELGAHLREEWQRIKEALLDERYEPQPVKRVEIPKPGGGMRRLGIPTVVDRLIQQALHQVMRRVFEPGFSESSYGFRPGRSAHGAVLKASEYVACGKHRRGDGETCPAGVTMGEVLYAIGLATPEGPRPWLTDAGSAPVRRVAARLLHLEGKSGAMGREARSRRQPSATSNAVTLRVLRLNSTPIRWMGSPRPRYLAA